MKKDHKVASSRSHNQKAADLHISKQMHALMGFDGPYVQQSAEYHPHVKTSGTRLAGRQRRRHKTLLRVMEPPGTAELWLSPGEHCLCEQIMFVMNLWIQKTLKKALVKHKDLNVEATLNEVDNFRSYSARINEIERYSRLCRVDFASCDQQLQTVFSRLPRNDCYPSFVLDQCYEVPILLREELMCAGGRWQSKDYILVLYKVSFTTSLTVVLLFRLGC